MYTESTIYQGFHCGDRIKRMMEQMSVRVMCCQKIKNSINIRI